MSRVSTVDRFVGQKVREFRRGRGMSMEKLAGGLGIAYQQLQKYETGRNRISAGRLFSISDVLEVPVQDFFPERQ